MPNYRDEEEGIERKGTHRVGQRSPYALRVIGEEGEIEEARVDEGLHHVLVDMGSKGGQPLHARLTPFKKVIEIGGSLVFDVDASDIEPDERAIETDDVIQNRHLFLVILGLKQPHVEEFDISKGDDAPRGFVLEGWGIDLPIAERDDAGPALMEVLNRMGDKGRKGDEGIDARGKGDTIYLNSLGILLGNRNRKARDEPFPGILEGDEVSNLVDIDKDGTGIVSSNHRGWIPQTEFLVKGVDDFLRDFFLL